MEIHEGTLKVHYDGNGEAIKSHQMKAKSVSKSILALETIYTEAFKEANKIFKSNINTEVFLEGGFNEGSLWWLIKILEKQVEPQSRINEESSFSIVSKAVSKAVELLKKISPEQAEIIIKETPDGYSIEIENRPVILNEVECAILTNEKIRSSISDLAMPLTDEGIDSLEIENYSEPNGCISVSDKDKTNLLIRRKHKHIIDEGKIEGFFYIETLSYNPKSKWKLISMNDPSFCFSGHIHDATFLKRISDNDEKFAKDDLLNISGSWYKEKSKLTGKTTTTYKILKVKEHVPVEDRQWKII